VIYGFLEKAKKQEELEWDVITGVSAGAITAGIMGLFPKDQSIPMAKHLVEKGQESASIEFFKKWED
jgi:predicted acylesterase/phospholipase RssA